MQHVVAGRRENDNQVSLIGGEPPRVSQENAPICAALVLAAPRRPVLAAGVWALGHGGPS